MNSRVLYIDNRRVDLPDSVSFNLVWQCADPGELKIYGSGSSTIKLPFTPANDAVFGNCKYLTVIGGREFDTFYNCRYYERGRLMIEDGTALLTAVSDGYEICLTWGNSELIQKLKDTTLYDKSIGAFKWDSGELYPLAETSERPNDYPAFYRDSGILKMRLAMNRPIVKYTDVLAVAGINKDNIPANVYRYIQNTYLQINGTQAIGYYSDAFTIEGPNETDATVASGIYGDDPTNTDEWFYMLGTKIGNATISNNGKYNITITQGYYGESGYRNQKTYDDVPFKSFCIFLTDKDYGGSIHVGRETFINNVFSNQDISKYEAMYRFGEKPGGNGWDVYEMIHPVAFGYVNSPNIPLSLVSCDDSDFGNILVTLAKKTYYIYICPKTTVQKVHLRNDSNGKPVFQRYFEGTVGVESIITFQETTVKDNYTKIESPDDEILKTSPPDKITMLGYKNAAEIVDDFLTLCPLMVIQDRNAKDSRLIYFGFDDVIANIGNPYDWSPYFVRLNKTKMGNDNIAKKNNVRFASYGDYAGFRADGYFQSFSLMESEKDYGTLKQIGNYDYIQSITVNDGKYDIPIDAGMYSLVKVNEKDGVYSAGGLNSIPSVFFYFKPNDIVKLPLERGGAAKVMFSDIKDMNTLDYIINAGSKEFGFWGGFRKVVDKQKTVTVTLNIDPYVLFGFDFRRPVYMKQLSVYVFAKKISYKGGGVAELQGIVLPSTTQGFPYPVDGADGMLVDSTDTYAVDSADTYIVEQ